MLFPHCKFGLAIIATFFAMTIGTSSSIAEEVVIEEGGVSGNVLIGDYSCSPCMSKLAAASLQMRDDIYQPGTIELSAGELWQFFDEQGYDSVNTMSLFLDVEQLGSEQSVRLSKLNVQIQNPTGGNLLTDANLGQDRLIVPGYETSSSRPEAELRFDLGYDFMKLFSPESTEMVRVSIESPVAGSLPPTFHLAANNSVFGRTDLGQLFLFVMFWGVVFLILLRWMKPVRQPVPVRSPMTVGVSRAAIR